MIAAESIPRTLGVAALVAIACSALIAGAVHVLRPIQQGHLKLERNRAIVEAAGLGPTEAAGANQIVAAFLSLDARVVDRNTGEEVSGMDGHAFDHWSEAPDQAGALVPVYLLRDGSEIERVVFPVDGPGMWSTIQVYVAVEADLATIADLVVFRHAETPGIGDRIEDPTWLETWRGKRLYDADGRFRFRVEGEASDIHGVDAITGATLTSVAVGQAVRAWFDEGVYAKFLERMARAEATL